MLFANRRLQTHLAEKRLSVDFCEVSEVTDGVRWEAEHKKYVQKHYATIQRDLCVLTDCMFLKAFLKKLINPANKIKFARAD